MCLCNVCPYQPLLSLSQRTSGYEDHISHTHSAFQSYQDETIAKWDTKIRLASGKLTNKVVYTAVSGVYCSQWCVLQSVVCTAVSGVYTAVSGVWWCQFCPGYDYFSLPFQAFVQVDRSALAQIKHVSGVMYSTIVPSLTYLVLVYIVSMVSVVATSAGTPRQRSPGEAHSAEEISVSCSRQGGGGRGGGHVT